MSSNTKSKVHFSGYDCLVQIQHFRMDKQICLTLVADNTDKNKSNDIFPNMPIGKASVFLEGIPVGKNQTLIKDCHENEGILKCLVRANIIKETGQRVQFDRSPNGFAYLVDVLIKE